MSLAQQCKYTSGDLGKDLKESVWLPSKLSSDNLPLRQHRILLARQTHETFSKRIVTEVETNNTWTHCSCNCVNNHILFIYIDINITCTIVTSLNFTAVSPQYRLMETNWEFLFLFCVSLVNAKIHSFVFSFILIKNRKPYSLRNKFSARSKSMISRI